MSARGAEAAMTRVRGRVLVAAVVAVVAIAGLVALLHDAGQRPVRSVRITGEFRHVSKDALRAAIGAHVARGVLEVDVDAVRRAALALPWVKDVSVRRVWPDSLHVAIVERVPVARWGDDALLEADGSVFRPDDVSGPGTAALPRLDGPEGSEREVLAAWPRIARALAALDRPVRRVTLTDRGGWRIVLAGDTTVVLGADQGPGVLAAYARALPAVLGGRLSDVERIDMRYVNGFAVRFRHPQPAEG